MYRVFSVCLTAQQRPHHSRRPILYHSPPTSSGWSQTIIMEIQYQHGQIYKRYKIVCIILENRTILQIYNAYTNVYIHI